MKNKLALLAIASLAFSSAVAQKLENDDMYFTSKDRVKLRELRNSQATYASSRQVEKKSDLYAPDEEANPTDSYSARNVNPEYTSRNQSQVSQQDEENYYVNNYRTTTQSNLNNFNNSYSSWYNSPWYSSSYNGSYMNNWNNPYFRSGYSSAFGYGYGNNYYGYGNGYGYPSNNMWNSWGMYGNSYGYNPYFSGYGYYGNYYNSGYYNNAYYGSYGYPSNNVADNSNYKRPVYGKRAVRSTNVVTGTPDTRTRSTYDHNRSTSSNNGGRTRGRQEEYYSNTSSNTYTPQDSRTSTQHNRASSWTNTNSSPSWGTESRSSSFGGSSGGSTTRTHSSSGGSGSNGRTRGRD
jgi:hypothetical protein